MHPQAILDDLAACGIAPRLTPDGCGIALPAGQLNPAQRTAITANKAALIVFLQAIDQVPPTPKKALALDPGARALLVLAMAFCDRTGAGDKARQDWQRDVADTPPELRADLYQHLRGQLPPAPPAPPAPPTAASTRPPAPAKPMGWLDMAQPWRAADRAYQRHHWKCSVCKAAARGHSERCTEGQRLRDMVYAAVDAAGNEAMLDIVAAMQEHCDG